MKWKNTEKTNEDAHTGENWSRNTRYTYKARHPSPIEAGTPMSLNMQPSLCVNHDPTMPQRYGTYNLEKPTTSVRQQTQVPKLFIASETLQSSQRLRQRQGQDSTVLGAL